MASPSGNGTPPGPGAGGASRQPARSVRPGAWAPQIGSIAGKAEYDGRNDLVDLMPANAVMGRAKIDGRPVAVTGDDFTVRGGSADARWGRGLSSSSGSGASSGAGPPDHSRSRGCMWSG